MSGTSTNAPSPPMTLRRTVALCAAGGFLDGYDLLIIGSALLLLVPQFNMSGAETGFVTATAFLGMIVGALLAGPIVDRVGRRVVFLIDVAMFLIFAILLGLSQTIWQLVILRFLIGLAIGIDMPTGSSMLAEFSPPRLRGALTSMINTAWLFGGFVAALVGFTLYQTAGPSAWRWMFASAALPALVILILRHGLPETPYWLRAAGRTDQAAGVERGLSEQGSATVPESEARGSFRELLRPGYAGPVAFFAIYWLVQAFLGAAPFTYTALIFSRLVKLPGATSLLLTAVLFALYVIFSLFCQFVLLEKLGRKGLALLTCGVAAIGGVVTGLTQNFTALLIISFAVLVVAVQMSTIPFWPWSVEQLPTRIRATGQSIGSAGGKLGLLLSVLLFTPQAIEIIGWTTYFVADAAGFVLLVVFVAVFGRETKSNDLDVLDNLKRADVPVHNE